MSPKKVALVVFLFLLDSAMNLAAISAQDTQNGTQTPEYYYEVVGASTQAPNVPRVWSESYGSEAEAVARLKQIIREHSRGGDLESDPEQPINLRVVKRLKTLKDAKSAVDKAKDILKGKEREVGATLKEYSEQIKAAWENVKNMKVALTSQTQAITSAQLDNVNNLIKEYNNSRDQFATAYAVESRPVLARYPAMSQVSAQDFEKKQAPDSTAKYTVWVFRLIEGQWVKQEDRALSTDDEDKAAAYQKSVNQFDGWNATSNVPKRNADLAGTYWQRRDAMNISNFSALGFNADGSVNISVYPDGRRSGRWSTDGDNVTLRDGNDGDTYHGTVSGNVMQIDFGRGPRILYRE